MTHWIFTTLVITTLIPGCLSVCDDNAVSTCALNYASDLTNLQFLSPSNICNDLQSAYGYAESCLDGLEAECAGSATFTLISGQLEQGHTQAMTAAMCGGEVPPPGVTTCDYVAVTTCSTGYANGLQNVQWLSATVCDDVNEVYAAAEACLEQFESKCSGEPAYEQIVDGFEDVHRNTLIQMGCEGGNFTSCTLQVQLTSADCLVDFSTAIIDLSNETFTDPLNADFAVFCMSLGALVDVARDCITTAADGDDTCDDFVEDTIRNLDLIVRDFDVYCGSGSGTSCPFSVQATAANCQLEFGTALMDIGNETFTDPANADLGVFCMTLGALLDDARACITTAASDNEMCDTIVEEANRNFDLVTEGYGVYCDSDCNVIRLTQCYGGFGMNMSLGDMFGDLTQTCNIYGGVLDCFRDYEQQCGDDAIVSMMGEGVMESLDMLESYCSPECSNMLELTANLQACIVGLPELGTTADGICSYLFNMMTCMDYELGDCAYITKLNQDQIHLQSIQAVFGCQFQLSDQQYENSCSIPRILSCTNPLLEAVGLPRFTRDTDLTTYGETIASNNVQTMLLLNNVQTCSAVRDNVNIQQYQACINSEFLKCPRDIFNSPNEWMDEDGDSDMNEGSEMEETDTMGPQDIEESIGPMLQLFRMLDEGSYNIELACSEGCEDIAARNIRFISCLSTQLGSVVDPNNIDSELQNLLWTVRSKYNSGQSYTLECRVLRGYEECASLNLAGCPATEYQVAMYFNNVYKFIPLDLCEVNLTFPIQDLPGSCTEHAFWRREMENVQSKCGHWMYHKDTFCSDLQEEIHCYMRSVHCCEVRKRVLEPMMHNWAMLNTVYDCRLKLESEPATDSLELLPMASPGGTCDYLEVLHCYAPLLSKFGIDTSNIKLLTELHIEFMMVMKHRILNDTANLCVPQSEFTTMETCANQLTAMCKYPSTCNAVSDDMSDDMSDGMNMGDSIGTIPMAKIMDFVSIKSICTQDCTSTEFTDSTLSDCRVERVEQLSDQIMWDQVRGVSTDSQCSELKRVSDCVTPKIGSCDYHASRVQAGLGLEAGSAVMEAAEQCGVTYGLLQQTQESTTMVPATTKGTQTTGAAAIHASLLLLLASLGLFWM